MVQKYKQNLDIDGRRYRVNVYRKVSEPPDAPRLVMAVYHPNEITARITQVAARSIRKFTNHPYELWIVDNASPGEFSQWLIDEPGVNAVFNRTEPLRPRQISKLREVTSRLLRRRSQMGDISYANGIGFEIGARLIDPESKFLCMLHSDILACKAGWLDYLVGKLSDEIRGSAVATHKSAAGLTAMSASGFLFDFTLFRSLNMHCLPNMPEWDAGELITIKLEEAGYRWFAADNTFDDPATIEHISKDSLLYELHSDRSFDDSGEVFFMHLGRGATKSTGRYHKPGKTYPEQWIAYAEEHLLN